MCTNLDINSAHQNINKLKILNSHQIKQIDLETITKEGIKSIDLMERASETFVSCLLKYYPNQQKFLVLCGLGNNGGDGLAIARILIDKQKTVSCFWVGSSPVFSTDAQINYERLKQLCSIDKYQENSDLTKYENYIIIDAVLGSGLNRTVEGIEKNVIEAINQSKLSVVSVDIPSGMHSFQNNDKSDSVVKAELNISFYSPHLSFLLPENAEFVQNFEYKSIYLITESIENQSTEFYWVDKGMAKEIYKPRTKFSHKGTYGNALIIAGTYGMMGAAVLATKACVKAGAGKTTAHVPSCGYEIMQNAIPEAMVWADYTKEAITTTYAEINDFEAVGIGPGIGSHKKTVEAFTHFLKTRTKPMVIDADALNILGKNKDLLTMIPKNSILTPHPKEFDRIFGQHFSLLSRIKTAQSICKSNKIQIVIKGTYTATVSINGNVYFNSTGNAGLAKGGSGDVLTGIITALLAQGYEADKAAILGVYIHGKTADELVKQELQSMETICASDICNNMHLAFSHLKK